MPSNKVDQVKLIQAIVEESMSIPCNGDGVCNACVVQKTLIESKIVSDTILRIMIETCLHASVEAGYLAAMSLGVMIGIRYQKEVDK